MEINPQGNKITNCNSSRPMRAGGRVELLLPAFCPTHIGSKDLSCFRKLLAKAPRSDLRAWRVPLCFELGGQQVAEGRVQAFLGIDLLETAFDENLTSNGSRATLS